MRWLFVVLLAGCSSPPSGPVWYGHVAGLKTPAGEEAVATLRQRLKGDDAANVRVRHAEAGESPRAAAVRLLGVNGVKGLILGPGLRDPEAVVAAVRNYAVPVIVLDEVSGPIDGAWCLGGEIGPRAAALAEYVWNEEKLKDVRADEGPFAVAFRRLGGKIAKTGDATVQGLTFRRGDKVVEATSDMPTAAEALDVLLAGGVKDGVAKREVKLKASKG